MVALSALENNIITKNFKVNCTGKTEMYGQTYHCWKEKGHGVVNLKEAMKQSCDTYFYEIARKLGVDRLRETSTKFGLGDKVLDKTFNNEKNFKKLSNGFEIKKEQEQAILKLHNEEHKASIIIACDGANSMVREKISINSLKHDFKQTALSFELKVKSEIQKQAVQFFLKDSILAVLPIRKGLVLSLIHI